MTELKYVGKYIPIHDAYEKVKGKLQYVADMEMDGMLHAKLLLSPIAHGVIKSIDVTKAEALPGVVKVYTYKNTPQNLYNSQKWHVGLEVVKDERLFTDKVRFVGDRVAAVVAKDKSIAEKAIELIEVQYQELPIVLDPEEALMEETIKIHDHGNVIMEKEISVGNVNEAMENAPIVVEDFVDTQKVHHAAMEPHICMTAIDSTNGLLTIWTPCQVVFQVRLIVAEALGLSLNRIRAIKTTVGGSFGGKGQPILEPVCAYFTYDLGVPVKLQLDRAETISSTRTRNATIGRVKTAVDKEGNILARDIDVLVDAGAYFTNGEAVTIAMGKKAFRLYDIKNQTYKGTAVYTNTPIAGACRGYGSPQIHALTEINIDNTAKKLGLDPVEFRLKNLVKPYAKDPTGGPELGNARVIDCLLKGMEVFDWKSKYNRPKATGRFVKGVGMACATHGSGYYNAYPDFITMDLRVTEDGEAILKASLHDLGCGTIVTIKQIVAEVLDINPDKILVPEADTLVSPFDSAGTQASRVTFVCGAAAKKTAELVKEKFTKHSADILKCNIDDILYKDGFILNKNNPQAMVSYGDMVMLIQTSLKEDISVSYTYKSPANPAVYGVNFAEVEIDTYTGLVRVIDIVAVHDIGKAINPVFVEGQVQGAIQMGIGFALTEEIVIDNKGNVKSNNFSKYHVINAPDMPDVKVHLIEAGEEFGPFGAKSVGEVSTVPIAPAIINGINHALDINITSLPATPEKILAALNNKKNLIGG
ncbi:xanthine dehydrogenase family protein molybdopterin-binding subunit [Alkaliphilus pronyensis]|nr:molybdopterin cofactor-binding domain-containing protein [Alkaliphilus pronyensis]